MHVAADAFPAPGDAGRTAVLSFRCRCRRTAALQGEAFGGMFLRDGISDVLKLFIYLVSGCAAFVYAKPYLADRGLFKGEFYMLCLFAVLGMMMMVSAGNLVTVYLGLELLALSLVRAGGAATATVASRRKPR
jgi:NADH:ubiquinone oxidoreductase subunit 2 (subunit N)